MGAKEMPVPPDPCRNEDVLTTKACFVQPKEGIALEHGRCKCSAGLQNMKGNARWANRVL